MLVSENIIPKAIRWKPDQWIHLRISISPKSVGKFFGEKLYLVSVCESLGKTLKI